MSLRLDVSLLLHMDRYYLNKLLHYQMARGREHNLTQGRKYRGSQNKRLAALNVG